LGSFTFSIALFLALQGTAAPPPGQRVDGKVIRPGRGRMDPVAGTWVTLHRVGTDRQSPLDSARTDARGRYSFRYLRTGRDDAIYFVSASYDGIAYFSSPLQSASVTGTDAEITVFDTTSRHVPITVRGHHLVFSSVDENAMRSVTEVYDLANDSSVTKIASGTGPAQAVWSARMLPGATGPAVREGDFPAAAVAFDRDRVALFAPLAPGLKQLAFEYSLPAKSFPLSVPTLEPTSVFEVMLEEKAGTATGSRLKEVVSVTFDQRSFRRFLASDVPVNSVATIDLPASPRAVDSRYLVALTIALGGVMIAVLAWALRRQ
jgi:hypothetical protein